jgi:hypothetical protein
VVPLRTSLAHLALWSSSMSPGPVVQDPDPLQPTKIQVLSEHCLLLRAAAPGTAMHGRHAAGQLASPVKGSGFGRAVPMLRAQLQCVLRLTEHQRCWFSLLKLVLRFRIMLTSSSTAL